ncbi:hypothetical protein ANN_27062, partial [Periplaneta americana]
MTDCFFCTFCNQHHLMWRPVPETQSVLNPEPFLTAVPVDIIRSGNFSHVPFMLGTNSQEGSLFLIKDKNTLYRLVEEPSNSKNYIHSYNAFWTCLFCTCVLFG